MSQEVTGRVDRVERGGQRVLPTRVRLQPVETGGHISTVGRVQEELAVPAIVRS